MNATLALMDFFNWTRIAIVYNERGVYFEHTALELEKSVVSDPNKMNIVKSTVDGKSLIHIQSVLNHIKSNVARIIFVSATPYEIAFLLCHAYEYDLVWSGHLWILHTHSLQEYVSAAPCEKSVLLAAIEKALLLTWNLEPVGLDVELISGKTYGQLKEEYLQELYKLSQEEEYMMYKDLITFEDQVYAYAMYDEIWALALALNQSIPELAEKNVSLSDIAFGGSNSIDTIENI